LTNLQTAAQGGYLMVNGTAMPAGWWSSYFFDRMRFSNKIKSAKKSFFGSHMRRSWEKSFDHAVLRGERGAALRARATSKVGVLVLQYCQVSR
jgi:hypothetical protein